MYPLKTLTPSENMLSPTLQLNVCERENIVLHNTDSRACMCVRARARGRVANYFQRRSLFFFILRSLNTFSSFLNFLWDCKNSTITKFNVSSEVLLYVRWIVIKLK